LAHLPFTDFCYSNGQSSKIGSAGEVEAGSYDLRNCGSEYLLRFSDVVDVLHCSS